MSKRGLDYFGARYYSAIQGRFIGADSAAPDPLLPQSFNQYRYAFNNPFSYLDPDGMYEKDVHHDLTYVLALAAGFQEKQASSIANENEGVDHGATGPFAGKRARERYHFTEASTRRAYLEQAESAAARTIYPWNNEWIYRVGIYMHAMQDSYSHEGFGPAAGQAWPPWTLDRPGKVGFIDESGRLVIAPAFDHAEPFSEGLSLVTRASETYPYLRYGFIDMTGNVVIRMELAEAYSFSDGLALVKIDRNVRGFMNPKR